MNISFNSQTPYQPYQNFTGAGYKNNSTQIKQSDGRNESILQSFVSNYHKDEMSEKQRLRQLVRSLNQTQKQDQNPYAVTSQDKMNGFLELSGASDSDKEEKAEKPVNYNYKEVASKIQRAKTSVSAEQAVLSAKRKVLEIKRKISVGEGDAEELQAVLTHAKSMETVARKKKHHLELEEMVVTTQKRDEKLDKMKEAASDMRSAVVTAEEEKVAQKEAEIFDERESMIEEAYEEVREVQAENADDMLAQLNSMIAEFGEEELKELEDAMAMLEDMEIVDPHMSKEDLEDLKRKHRASENKAIAKADMDYLKTMIKHQLSANSGLKGVGMTATSAAVAVTPAMNTPVAMPDVAAQGTVSIDVQI